ncbi:hypothetical protein C3K47_16645 [Solitalea longa]|uniref:Uncharacterized protein n=1 Tax=Solitalea longa TaxID=2079460 RepID=A0A2S4ZY18_9SPHI|nr:four helix bundle protein [Solitalea longa]POY35205.1 hypothetical protein C3K47_16645 [Solitalea longa]
MFDNEDDDFEFESGDFDPDAYRREQERIQNLPVYKKAVEVAEITRAICGSIDPEKDLMEVSEQMLTNAYMLGAKIAAAEGGDLYTLRMENAVIIKIHARELMSQTTLCKMEELADEKYLQLLWEEIDSFRRLFVNWVTDFDRNNDIQDEWGLFY